MKLTYDLLKTQKTRDEKCCNAFQLILCPVFPEDYTSHSRIITEYKTSFKLRKQKSFL